MKKKNFTKKVILPTALALSVTFAGFSPLSTYAAIQTETNEVIWQAPKGLNKEEVVQAYLQDQLKDETQSKARSSKKSVNQFKIIDEHVDKQIGTIHMKTVEQVDGVPVYGSGQTISLDENLNVYASIGEVNDELVKVNINTTPSITKEEAESHAKAAIENEVGAIKDYDGIETELMVFPKNDEYHLTYLVKASTSIPVPGYFHYFIDAHTGEVQHHFNALHSAEPETETVSARGLDLFGKMQNFNATKNIETGKTHLYSLETVKNRSVPIHTYDAARMGETPFILLSALLGFTGFEVETASNFFYDPAAISAQQNSIKVNKYFQNQHDRNSLDNDGMKIISTVHIGEKWNNAAWNGKQMLYGDGDGSYFSSLAGALDVAGHEMTHGVITNTANLTYEGESGALNESIADIFGVLAENHFKAEEDRNWLIGEDVYTPNIANDGGLRSLEDPKANALHPNYGLKDNRYPDHYDDRYLGELDEGGVHINSSINNKAAYLIAEGGEHYGTTVNGIGSDKLGKILYKALTVYLVPSSNFSEMREAMVQSARDLYPDKNGEPSAETAAVMAAYDSIGVLE
ncbi:peptidase M4 family protein [Cytobacillus sp. Sa5YUA1]|uniref:Neutral metalloproteinase n=1 Tax=Cytobacillus stercorigallinarum TaxID=2762240 RepID=A0ABR8QU20_9BACI|nr:M4 family metallopeptidase [Cytobacillus stercorigallinarum]MBD7938924.1 peptidase M4 family protein [Cytobacillus stercorigallinarum]